MIDWHTPLLNVTSAAFRRVRPVALLWCVFCAAVLLQPTAVFAAAEPEPKPTLLAGSDISSLPGSAQPSGEGQAQIQQPVGIGYIELAPLMMTLEGKPAGELLEATKELMQEAGLAYVFIPVPAGKRYVDVAASSAALHMFFGSLKKCGLPVKPSTFNQLVLNLYGRAGDRPPSLAALKNVPVITVYGHTYNGYRDQLAASDQGVVLVPTPSHLAAFQLLLAGRAPYVLDYTKPSRAVLAQLDVQDLEITHVDTWSLHLQVSKKAPAAQLLRSRLAAAAARIMERRRNSRAKEEEANGR